LQNTELTFHIDESIFLWPCTKNQMQKTDYNQHVAAVTFTIGHLGLITLSFYYLFIRLVEWMLPLNTYYGPMLWEIIISFSKATKMVNLMINIAVAFYATPDFDHKCIFKEMTKICHLAFSNKRMKGHTHVPPIKQNDHLLFGQKELYQLLLPFWHRWIDWNVC